MERAGKWLELRGAPRNFRRCRQNWCEIGGSLSISYGLSSIRVSNWTERDGENGEKKGKRNGN